ncbi:MAG: PAS domain S-box protein [Caloramator sp.]|nr:PAS domain S-box protein [Caloramator sp.]
MFNLNIDELLDAMEHIFFFIDNYWNVNFVSRNIKKILGYSSTDVLGNNIADYIFKYDLRKAFSETMYSIQTRESKKVECRVMNKKGNFVWMEAIFKPLFDQEGNLSGLYGVLRDIEDKKTVIKEKEKNIEKFKTIIESTKGGICVHDDNNILEMNGLFKKMFGIEDEKCAVEKILDFVSNNLKKPEIFLNRLDSLLKSKGIRNGRVETKDGKVYEYYTKMIHKNKQVYGRIWHIFDVTAQVKYEEQLKKKEEQYRKFFELMPDPIIVHKNGLILYANKAAKEIVKCENLVGRSMYDFLHEDFKKIVMERVKETYEKCITLPWLEEKLIDVDGNIIDVEVAATPVDLEGEVVSLVVVRDLRQKKELERNRMMLNEAMELERLRSEFFANISHELRTPLNVILGAIQLMQVYIKNEDIKTQENLSRYIKMMKQNCFRLLRLVNNLIDITKIDSGYFEIHPQNIDIIKLIENIVLSVKDYVERFGLNIYFNTDIKERIIGVDPDKIERILLNLISNAIKFTDEGGSIFVKISNSQDYIKISVKDTGIGIPKEKLDIIFDRFRQVDKSLSRNHEGSGIGLSLVKALVEMHDGEIAVTSEEGEGSEFTIILPAKLAYADDKIYIEKNMNNNYVERINIEFSDIYS